MITTTNMRLMMLVLWLGMMFMTWDLIWVCLVCITAVDILDTIED